MKYLIKAIFTIITAILFTAASAQTKPAPTGMYLKFEVNGKAASFKPAELVSYNQFEPGNETERAGNKHVFTVVYAPKSAFELRIVILTAPHTNPVAGKIPFEQTETPKDGPCPAAYLYLTKQTGKEYDFYHSGIPNAGSFEITKIAGGWVEGKFALDMPNQFDDDEQPLHITNGSFRFKIDKESREK